MRKIVLFLLAMFFLLQACISFCENTIVQTIVSKNITAYIFQRACGATTGNSIQVSVLDSNKALPNKPGNIFILDSDSVVTATWTTDTNLLITYECDEEQVRKKEMILDDITIEYLALGRSEYIK